MSIPSVSTNYQHPHHPPPPSKYQNDFNHENDQERTNYIIDTFITNFGDSMRENPKGWRGRFRKMAADEFAFFRGSAVLFYRDLQRTLSQDSWIKNCEKASHIFIHVSYFSSSRKIHSCLFFIKGDLHAENFGTYIDRFGVINFGVNDFDEVLK